MSNYEFQIVGGKKMRVEVPYETGKRTKSPHEYSKENPPRNGSVEARETGEPEPGYAKRWFSAEADIRADERAKVLAEVVGVLDAESVACQGNAERTNALNWAIAAVKALGE